MPRCIYCLDEKPPSGFNREHVIPEAFGRFRDNLVLECVCRACNDHFGQGLDLKLARDSIEGFERFARGVKSPKAFKTLGKRTTTRIEVQQDGPMMGVRCKPQSSSDGRRLDLEPLPQLGFARSEGGPHEYFLLDDLPSKEELIARGYRRGSTLYVRTVETDWDEAMARLAEKGFAQFERAGTTDPESGRVYAEFVFRVASPEFRAATKIAMNYLAHVAGPGFALMAEFNEARRYVSHDAAPPQPIVTLGRAMKIQRRANGRLASVYLLSVERRDHAIIAQVQLSFRFRYIVTLSRGPFLLLTALRQAHVFDLERRRVVQHAPPPEWA